jgi:hypothetical protein
LLSPNLISSILRSVRANPARERELLSMALRVTRYLEDFPSGWGEWPDDTGEALYVGLLLGIWFAKDIEEQLLDLPEEELAFMEEECRERGLSTEQYLFDRLVEVRESDL